MISVIWLRPKRPGKYTLSWQGRRFVTDAIQVEFEVVAVVNQK